MVFQSYAIVAACGRSIYGLRVRDVMTEITKIGIARSKWCSSWATRMAASGGQQQRVALARAFVFQPSVLFDELWKISTPSFAPTCVWTSSMLLRHA